MSCLFFHRFIPFCLLFIGAIAPHITVANDSVWKLAPVVVNASPLDVLRDDPVVPSRSSEVRMNSGTGGLQRSLYSELALPISDSGRPGNVSQFIGLGVTADDTSVSALGVPLNPAEGLGFDFSAFPQFLWSSYPYQNGPALGGFEPRAASGSLTLIPWSQAALDSSEEPVFRFTQGYSGAGLLHMSLAGKSNSGVAAVVGYNEGLSSGPAGVISVVREISPRVTARFHLLGTSQESQPDGFISYPTPNARQLSARMIPVAQLDTRLDEALLKSSLYFDASYFKLDDSDHPWDQARNHVRHAGFENALLIENWKLGASLRYAGFTKIDQRPPTETYLALQGSRVIEMGSWLIEPLLQVSSVSRMGVLPAGSLGAKLALDSRNSLFSRWSYFRKFPSLSHRYFDASFARGNPSLRPEKDYTWILGHEFRGERLRSTVQAVGQLRQEIQVTTQDPDGYYIVRNQGMGRLGALMHEVDFLALGWLSISNGLTVAASRIDRTGLGFPYLPGVTDVLGLSVHSQQAPSRWSLSAAVRLMSQADFTASAGRLPSVGVLDLSAATTFDFISGFEAGRRIELRGTVQNVMDRPIEVQKGYRPVGRELNLSLVGYL